MSAVTIGDMTFPIPFADLLPPLTEQQYAELKADIAERGIVVPVILGKNNRIIDGQHRMRIAEELGLSLYDIPRETQAGLNDDQEHDLCIDLNTHRRQLTAEERQDAAVKLRAQGKSYRQIGEELGVDASTVYRDITRPTVAPATVETAPDSPSPRATPLVSLGSEEQESEQATVRGRTVEAPPEPAMEVAPAPSPTPPAFPDRIVGRDGKSRPATQPRPVPVPELPPLTAMGAQLAETLEQDGAHYDTAVDQAIRGVFARLITVDRHARNARLFHIPPEKAAERWTEQNMRTFETQVRPLFEWFQASFEAARGIKSIRRVS